MIIAKGQRVKLSDITASTKITISIPIEMTTGEADVSCFGVDAHGKLSDDRYFIFYNQTSSPEGAIKMEKSNISTDFHIDLSSLPQTIHKLVFTVTNDNGMPVTTIRQGKVQVKDNGIAGAEIQFAGSDFNQEKAIIISEIYNKDGIWRISSILNGFNGGLSALLSHFGGEEAAPSHPQPSAPSRPASPPSQPSAPQQTGGNQPFKPSFTSPAPQPPQNTVPDSRSWSSDLSKKANVVPPIKAQGSSANTYTPINKSVVSLKKPGESHKISLKKGNDKLHVNLNWNQKTGGFFGMKSNVDLDLACLYILKDGSRGIVQALGRAFGNEAIPPYIRLDGDDRSGTNTNGENMFFARPETIELAVVFAYIYDGAPSWKSTDGVITIKQSGQPDIQISLENSNTKDRFCVIATFRSIGGELEVRREEKYFKGHREVDNFYQIGLRWQTGRK